MKKTVLISLILALRLNAQIVTIQGTDTLANSRGIINSNFAYLNTQKVSGAGALINTTRALCTVSAGVLGECGHMTVEGVTSTGASGTGKFLFDTSPTITGHPTIEGVTSTGATGTGPFMFGVSPTTSGLLTAEKISATSADGQTVGNSRVGWYWQYTSNGTSDPTFSNDEASGIVYTFNHGWNDSDATAKLTVSPLSTYLTGPGQGQKMGHTNVILDYGMGDAFFESRYMVIAGGANANGDEGQALSTTNLFQASQSPTASIDSVPTPTSCNTTFTAPVTKSATAQSVAVADSTGCLVNDWIVASPSDYVFSNPRQEAVQITAVADGTHITARFNEDHASGQTIVPATVLNLNPYSFGEGRYLINTTPTPYTTGAVASISGATFTGDGVGGQDWTGLAGQCISLDNDTTGDGMRDWFGIVTASGTSLTIGRYAGIGYTGNGVGSGAYRISPCAQVLRIPLSGSGGQVVLTNNPWTWTASNIVENAVSSDGYMGGNYYRVGAYLPSTIFGPVTEIDNFGEAPWKEAALSIKTWYPTTSSFVNGLYINSPMTQAHIDLSGISAISASMHIATYGATDRKDIHWDDYNTHKFFKLGFDSTLGDNGGITLGGGAGSSTLQLAGNYNYTMPAVSGTLATSTPGQLTRTIPGTAGSTVAIGSFAQADPYGASYQIDIVARDGSIGGIAKTYSVTVAANSGGWNILAPSWTSFNGTLDWDFELEISNSAGSTTDFRIRRTAGSNDVTAYINLVEVTTASGGPWPFTPDTSTGSGVSAPTAYYPNGSAIWPGSIVLAKSPTVLATLDPSGLSASRTYTLPDAAGTVAAITGTTPVDKQPACFSVVAGVITIVAGTNTAGVLACP